MKADKALKVPPQTSVCTLKADTALKVPPQTPSLYFESGQSTIGATSDFQFNMSLDARGKTLMSETETVEVIHRVKIKNPQFLLALKEKWRGH